MGHVNEVVSLGIRGSKFAGSIVGGSIIGACILYAADQHPSKLTAMLPRAICGCRLRIPHATAGHPRLAKERKAARCAIWLLSLVCAAVRRLASHPAAVLRLAFAAFLVMAGRYCGITLSLDRD